jgi:hypothetical protein
MVEKLSSLFERSWKWRRWAAFSQLAVLDALIGYIVIFGADDSLRREGLSSLILLVGAVYNGYTLGSIWDDRNKDKAIAEAVKKEPDQ